MDRDGTCSPSGKGDALQPSASCRNWATPTALSECKTNNARMRVAIAGWLRGKVKLGDQTQAGKQSNKPKQ
eukprot:11172527-Lingulodinium_polyedra.AAC.1